MKKKNIFAIVLILCCTLLGCSNGAKNKSQAKVEPPAATKTDKMTNELGVSPHDIAQQLSLQKEDHSAIDQAVAQNLKELNIKEEIAIPKAQQLIRYQQELEAYVKNFHRLNDQQLYSLLEEQHIVNGWLERKLYELSKSLAFHEKEQKELIQKNQQLEQTIQNYVEQSKLACNAIANPQICKRMLALTQLFAIEQMALCARLQDDDAAQKKLSDYINTSTKGIFDNVYLTTIKDRLYQLKTKALSTPTPDNQEQILDNYILLKKILKDRKVGISDQDIMPLIEAREKQKTPVESS